MSISMIENCHPHLKELLHTYVLIASITSESVSFTEKIAKDHEES